MASTGASMQKRGGSRVPSTGRLVILHKANRYPTTRLEQLLLMAAIVLIPLEDHIPAVAGYSIMFLCFGVLAGYVLLYRPGIVAHTWGHSIFLIGYALIVLATLIESSRPYTNYGEIFRIGQMIVGGVLVASLCRDRQALQSCMYGYLIAGLWLSILLFLTTYGALQGAVATDFQEASLVRAKVFEEQALHVNLNRMAFFTAQGAVVGLVLALTASSPLLRNLFFGLTGLCIVASFLPLSRSGIVTVVVACATVTFVYGVTAGRKHFNRFVRTILFAIGLGACILIWVPNSVFSRLEFSTQTKPGEEMEARAHLYTAALEHLPEYVVTGIGVGNYWESWGRRHGFGAHDGGVYGAHSSLIQATIYWGLIGLLPLLGVIYQAYRCLPKRCGVDVLSLCLLGVSVSLLLYMMVTHVLAFKGFSIGLGILVGARLWIWPQGIVQPTAQLRIYPSVIRDR